MKEIQRPYGTEINKGRIRVIIRYRSTGEIKTFEGVFNPDSNLKVLAKIIRKRAPKITPVFEVEVAGGDKVIAIVQ